MFARSIPPLLFVALVGWMGTELLMAWPNLPERVATHFNAAGDANGWSTRGQLLLTITALFAGFGALFLAAGWLDRLPNTLVNIPNKEHWLDTERRAASFATICDYLRYLLLAPMAFLVLSLTAVLHANLAAKPHLDLSPSWPLAVLFAAMAAMFAWFYWRFRAPHSG